MSNATSDDIVAESQDVLPSDTIGDLEIFIKLIGPLFDETYKKDIFIDLKGYVIFVCANATIYVIQPSESPDDIVRRIVKLKIFL